MESGKLRVSSEVLMNKRELLQIVKRDSVATASKCSHLYIFLPTFVSFQPRLLLLSETRKGLTQEKLPGTGIQTCVFQINISIIGDMGHRIAHVASYAYVCLHPPTFQPLMSFHSAKSSFT